MASMILTSGVHSLDIAPALLDYGRDIDTTYFYEVETMDGKLHKAVRSTHEIINVTLGADKWKGSSRILNSALYFISTYNDITLTIDNVFVGDVFVEIENMIVDHLDEQGNFLYDMLQLKIIVRESGVIV